LGNRPESLLKFFWFCHWRVLVPPPFFPQTAFSPPAVPLPIFCRVSSGCFTPCALSLSAAPFVSPLRPVFSAGGHVPLKSVPVCRPFFYGVVGRPLCFVPDYPGRCLGRATLCFLVVRVGLLFFGTYEHSVEPVHNPSQGRPSQPNRFFRFAFFSTLPPPCLLRVSPPPVFDVVDGSPFFL